MCPCFPFISQQAENVSIGDQQEPRALAYAALADGPLQGEHGSTYGAQLITSQRLK